MPRPRRHASARRAVVALCLLLSIGGCASRDASIASAPPVTAATAENSRYDPLILRLRETGRQRVALLGPDTAETRLVWDRLAAAHAAGTVTFVAGQLYRETAGPAEITDAMRELARYRARTETLADFLDVFRYAYEEIADPQLALAAAMKDLQRRMGRMAASPDPATPRLSDSEYGAALTQLLTSYRTGMQQGHAPHDAMQRAVDKLARQRVLGEPGFDAVVLPAASDGAQAIASMLAEAGAAEIAIYHAPIPARQASSAAHRR